MLASLSQLSIGDDARIVDLAINGLTALRQRLLAMGFVPGAVIKVTRVAPFGGPMEIKLFGNISISIRKKEGVLIQVEKIASSHVV